jgi:hypothetical protein
MGLNLEGRGLDARLFRIGGIHNRRLVSMTFGPTQIHPHQHLGPISRIDPTRTGADRHHRSSFVILAVEQSLNLHLDQVMFQGIRLSGGLVKSVLIAFLASHLDQCLHILQTLLS